MNRLTFFYVLAVILFLGYLPDCLAKKDSYTYSDYESLFYFKQNGTDGDDNNNHSSHHLSSLNTHNYRFFCPRYSAQEVGALLCSGWHESDFSYVVEKALQELSQEDLSRDDLEQQLLNNYALYGIPGFREYIKTLPSYKAHIKKAHAQLVAQKGKYYRLRRALGSYTTPYIQALDAVEGLFADVMQQEKVEQRATSYLALQETHQAMRTAYAQQASSLQTLSDEWVPTVELHHAHGKSASRYQRRLQALNDINTKNCHYKTQRYTLSPAASKALHAMNADAKEYQTLYGNELQQVIHQECREGIERVALLPITSCMYPYKNSIAHSFDAAHDYNRLGLVDKAIMIVDFCYALLDCTAAAAEGAAHGIMSTARDMVEHPGQTLLCAVAGEYVFAYELSKVLYNVADISITYAVDEQNGKTKWNEYVAPVTKLIKAVSDKELSLRDAVKGSTEFAVQWKAQGKLLRGLNMLFKTAKTQAIKFAKNNPLASPQQHMVTPQGMILHSANTTPQSGSRFNYQRTSTFFTACEQEIVDLAQQSQHAMQPHQDVLKALGKNLLHAPEKFFKHIFSAELIEKVFPNGKVQKTLSGFHHYADDHLNMMNVKLQNIRTCNKTGLSIADILCGGHLEKNKTFFPTSWSREKIISKLIQAAENPTQAFLIDGSRGIFFGKTSEGIIIKFVVDLASGNYITAYADAVANGLL